MKKTLLWFLVMLVVGSGRPPTAFADASGQEYLLRVSKDSALTRVCDSYGLRVVRRIGWLSLYVVAGPEGVSPADLIAKVRADRRVRSFEPDLAADTGMTASAHPNLEQTTESLETALALDRTASDFYGALAWNGYSGQPALDLIHVADARAAAELGEG